MSEPTEQGALNQAEQIIERFGGIRPMAGKMLVPVTTVQGWKKRGVIPANRRDDVLRAAQINNIDLSGLTDPVQDKPVREEGSRPFSASEPTIADMTAGLFAALGVFVALIEREKSGEGDPPVEILRRAKRS